MADNFHIKLDSQAGRDVDAYLEYRRIVGDDDGGKPFTPEQFEQYKKKVLPLRMKNRIFVCYTNPEGMDCILIGPETECFCLHRFKQHKTDFETIPEDPDRRLLKCEVRGCRCACFIYPPKNNNQPVRCHCKHETQDHSEVAPFLCKKPNCKCQGYKSSWSCECGYPAFKHHMVYETKSERLARGHPVGQDVPYKAMGGLTGFSSLAAGYMRLDQSGQGAPSEEFLNQQITASDHPFLRANVKAINQHEMAQGGPSQQQLTSQMRQPGESELDFYDRRYKEKEKQKYQPKRIEANPQQRGVRGPPQKQLQQDPNRRQ